MTSNIQPTTPLEDNQPEFRESTLLIEDQENLFKHDDLLNIDAFDKTSSDNPFTIECNNSSGGLDYDTNFFFNEEEEPMKPPNIEVPQSPSLIEVPSNADFFNMKSSQEYIIEEDQNLNDDDGFSFEEERPSDDAPFTDATESSFMAGASNVNQVQDNVTTKLRFSCEASYTSSSTTDPNMSVSAPSISIMENDDNPYSLTSPQNVSPPSSSDHSESDERQSSRNEQMEDSPPTKSAKTETKSTASQNVIVDTPFIEQDELSGYTSDISSQSKDPREQSESKLPYYELRISIAQFNFFRVVRVPQTVDMHEMYLITMESLDWDDDKYREHPHYFRDETGRIFASKMSTMTNVPPQEEEVREERNYKLNQVLKHDRSVVTLHYTSKTNWVISIALQQMFDEKPPQDAEYNQNIYCISGRGGSINENDTSKSGKFNKSQVNARLLSLKFKDGIQQ